VKLNQEFDIFVLTENNKRKQEALEPMFRRLENDCDGRPILKRHYEGAAFVPGLAVGGGDQICDGEEICDDNESGEDE